MTKALIYGTGSIGSVYGYILHKAGVDVIAVCRSNYEAVKKNGITIRSVIWGDVRYHPTPVRSVEDACAHGPFDFILVCTKAFAGYSQALEPAVSPQTAIIIAQNGIGVEEEYADLYPDNAIISGVVWLPATPVSPGVVKMGPMERIGIGKYPSTAGPVSQAKVKELARLWTAGGGSPTVHDDIQSERWGKLAVNCAFNPMGALSRCDGANLLLSSDVADDVVVEVLREVGRVAAAAGYPEKADEAFVQKNMAWHRASMETGGKDQSMLVDVKADRPIEVEAILGNTLKIAKHHGVVVPRLQLLYCLARALNFSIQKPKGCWMPTKF